MFKNAGKKIKMLAKITFYIIVIASVAIGLIGFQDMGALSLLVIPIGFIVGWFCTILSYALGELCENVYEIRNTFLDISHIKKSQ